MKTIISAFFFLFSFTYLHAQAGFYIDYLSTPQTKDWVSSNKDTDFIGTGLEVGASYLLLQSQNIRLEFHLGAAYSVQTQDFSLDDFDVNTNIKGFHSEIGAKIYPLDLKGDCDCPTWRREGPTLEKGLYFEVATGLSAYNFSTKLDDIEVDDSSSHPWFAAGGIGFDIGIDDLITITPQASLRYYPSASWDAVNILEDSKLLPFESELIQYSFGVQLYLNLDEL